MNIQSLSTQAGEALGDKILEAGTDIEALVLRCEQESERQGRKILPRLGFTLTIEGNKATYALSYGARVKREGVLEFEDENQEKLPLDPPTGGTMTIQTGDKSVTVPIEKFNKIAKGMRK